MDLDLASFCLGGYFGLFLAAAGVALGLYLGDRRVAQRQRLAALRLPPPDAPPTVCGGADGVDGESFEDRLQRDPDAWKDP